MGGKLCLPGRSHESPPPPPPSPSRFFFCVVREPANALRDHSDHHLSRTRFYITSYARAHKHRSQKSTSFGQVHQDRKSLIGRWSLRSRLPVFAHRRHEAGEPSGKHCSIKIFIYHSSDRVKMMYI